MTGRILSLAGDLANAIPLERMVFLTPPPRLVEDRRCYINQKVGGFMKLVRRALLTLSFVGALIVGSVPASARRSR